MVTLFQDTLDKFVRSNANFESSIPINAAIDDMVKLTNLQEIFMIPLQRQLFNYDSALKWVLFLTVMPERVKEEGDDSLTDYGKFSCEDALKLISQVYDIGMQENIWVHLEEDDDDDGESQVTEEAED